MPKHNVATCKASKVLERGTGWCYAKSHLPDIDLWQTTQHLKGFKLHIEVKTLCGIGSKD